jgi:hypothetical protein
MPSINQYQTVTKFGAKRNSTWALLGFIELCTSNDGFQWIINIKNSLRFS